MQEFTIWEIKAVPVDPSEAMIDPNESPLQSAAGLLVCESAAESEAIPCAHECGPVPVIQLLKFFCTACSKPFELSEQRMVHPCASEQIGFPVPPGTVAII
jgi:hypothetical protein